MNPDSSKAGLEKLSLTLIEVLKDLSAARTPLTADALTKAFEKRKDLIDLVAGSVSKGGAPNGNGRKTLVKDELQTLKEENRRLRDQETRLLRQVKQLEDESVERLAFSRRALLTLIALAHSPTNQALASSLDALRGAVMNDAPLDDQINRLQELKDLIQREAPTHGQPLEIAAPVLPKGLERVPGTGGPDPGEPSLYVTRVQSAFLSILSQLEPVGEQHGQQMLSELRMRIAQCRDMDTLVSLGEDLVGFVRNSVGKLIQQSDQVAVFAKELGKNLSEMEEQVLVSLNIAQEGHQANTEFATTLRGQVEDIQGSFTTGGTIQDIQIFVFSKLKAIRTALELKNSQDEDRFRQAQGSMEDLKRSLQIMTAEVNRVQERARVLEREVLLDGLTGIHNRRAYEQRIKEEFARYRRYGMTYSLVLLDVDHFKKLNDQYGHRAGDKCLKEIIKRVKSCTRSTDFIARYGGEEFVIVLTGTNKAGAYVVAEKVRRVIEKTRFSFQNNTLPVTISLGVSEISPADKDVDAIFSRADTAMYRAKSEGRNRVCVE